MKRKGTLYVIRVWLGEGRRGKGEGGRVPSCVEREVGMELGRVRKGVEGGLGVRLAEGAERGTGGPR